MFVAVAGLRRKQNKTLCIKEEQSARREDEEEKKKANVLCTVKNISSSPRTNITHPPPRPLYVLDFNLFEKTYWAQQPPKSQSLIKRVLQQHSFSKESMVMCAVKLKKKTPPHLNEVASVHELATFPQPGVAIQQVLHLHHHSETSSLSSPSHWNILFIVTITLKHPLYCHRHSETSSFIITVILKHPLYYHRHSETSYLLSPSLWNILSTVTINFTHPPPPNKLCTKDGVDTHY